jgi:hypothetical protein
MTRIKPHEYNENSHDLHYPYDTKSIVVAVPQGTTCESFILSPKLEEVLTLLRAKRPAWTFVSVRDYIFSTVRTDDVDVYENGEPVGRIWVEAKSWKDETTIISFTNTRIARAQKRSDKAHSQHAKVAARKILEMMYSKTPSEQATELRDSVRSTLGRLAAAAESATYCHDRKISEALMGIAAREWEKLVSMFPELKEHEGWQAARAHARDMGALYKQSQNHGLTVKQCADGSYLTVNPELSSDNPDRVTRYKAGELPEAYTASLGLLKLSETDTAIPGIGCRVSATEFYLLRQE